MSREFNRLGELVGRQGKINRRAKAPAATGSWAASVDAVSTLIADGPPDRGNGPRDRRRGEG